MDAVKQLLRGIYSDTPKADAWQSLLEEYATKWSAQKRELDTQDVCNEALAVIISYGDSLIDAHGEKPLKTLLNFLSEETQGLVSGLHILPYFPYTSDDGFSISDYRQVREDLGTWDDIENIGQRFVLMSDLVLNHCSSKHAWFEKFLQNEKPFDEFFTTEDKDADLSQVVRPRPHFVLSEYQTTQGTRHVWTTFSRDQVDLDYANPLVLFEMLDTLMEYVQVHHSRIIRLDAIAYLWKERGTSCIHLEKTHLVVKLMRALLDEFAAGSVLITETNVPHEENISYFGNGDEAHMVYQFPLPPLLSHAFVRTNTEYLCAWAEALPQPQKEKKQTYFNFCASHDGIGITPTHGIVPQQEREALIERVKERGARISYKATADGEIPYEINVNYLSAIAKTDAPVEKKARAFLASQSVLLAMPGVPGIYIHSLLGSENWSEGVEKTGANRSINREKLDVKTVREELANQKSLRYHVFQGYLQLLAARRKSSAFAPYTPMQVLPTTKEVFAFVRGAQGEERVLCMVNVSDRAISQQVDATLFAWKEGCADLFTDDAVFIPMDKDASGKPVVLFTLEPHEVLWLREGLTI